MALRELSRADREALRDRVETALELAMRRAIKRFLSNVRNAALASLSDESILASAGVQPHIPLPDDSMLTLGEVSGWWAAEVDGSVQQSVRDQWSAVYRATSDGQITQTSLDGLDDYMGKVTDRLVRGIEPPLPDAAFDRVRVSVTQGAAQGWSREQTAGRIAAELGWETSGPYWRGELSRANSAIDAILDPLGPPGTPIREFTRLHDPAVRALQADRSNAVSRLDAEKSYWHTRAARIARTEATGANGYASMQALKDEGVLTKEWLATGDARTRAEHLDADGQTVGIDEEFIVGFDALMFPGDPVGAPENVINCRCTMTEGGIENQDLADERAEREMTGNPMVMDHGKFSSLDDWAVGDLSQMAKDLDWVLDGHLGRGDLALRRIMQMQGWGKPTVLSPSKFDQAVSQKSLPRFYRGVVGHAGGEQGPVFHRKFLTDDDPWVGMGVHGNGYYFTTNFDTARVYADDVKGSILEVALKPGAKVGEWYDLKDDWLDWVRAQVGDDSLSPGYVPYAVEKSGAMTKVFSDLGRWAAGQGYDAIKVSQGGAARRGPIGGDNYVILNRSALIAKEPQ